MDKNQITISHNIQEIHRHKGWEAGNNDKTLVKEQDVQVSEGNLFFEIELKIADIKLYETYEAIAIPIFQNENNTQDATIWQITIRFILINRVNIHLQNRQRAIKRRGLRK